MVSFDPKLLSTSVLVTFAIGLLLFWRRKQYRKSPFPPGPKGFPIIGNLLDISRKESWLTFTQRGEKYGNICYARAFNRSYVILNTLDAIRDLLEKRSSNYSDRPPSVMIYDEMKFDWLTTMLPYGERHHKHRALMRKYLQPNVAKNYFPIQIEMSHRLIGNISRTPQHFLEHIRSATGAIIMKVAYGYEVLDAEDPFVKLSDNALQWLSKAGVPAGGYWVDYLPWLQFMPSWFPGMGWKVEGKLACALSRAMAVQPFEISKEKYMKGEIPSAIVTSMLKNSRNDEGEIENEEIIAETLTTLYAGGSDPTVSTITSTVLAFLIYPDVLKKAQIELDRVIGGGRLPSFEDRESLPYIEAILKEALRWYPVVPLGVSHRATAEDIYKGYVIPEGSVIIPNQWAVLHDETTYPDPFRFWPERWLNDQGKLLHETEAPLNPSKVAFGFGRRLCPGVDFAETTAFIEIATMVAVFSFENPRDENGMIIMPSVKYRSGLLCHPEPFKCKITVRSKEAEVLIRDATENLKSCLNP